MDLYDLSVFTTPELGSSYLYALELARIASEEFLYNPTNLKLKFDDHDCKEFFELSMHLYVIYKLYKEES